MLEEGIEVKTADCPPQLMLIDHQIAFSLISSPE
jgi:hypothetical protein